MRAAFSWRSQGLGYGGVVESGVRGEELPLGPRGVQGARPL